MELIKLWIEVEIDVYFMDDAFFDGFDRIGAS